MTNFLWDMVNDALKEVQGGCAEEGGQSKRQQQLGNQQRPGFPSNDKGSGKGYPGNKGKGRGKGKPAANQSEQRNPTAEWSRTPPQQGGNRGNGAVQPPQYNNAEWASLPQDDHVARGQARYVEDEMNLRDAQTPSRQQSEPAAGSRQPPAGSAQAQSRQQQQQQRQQQGRRNDDKQDTMIGKGFTAAMRRGVAQAKPTPNHEELKPSKDGGFVATIQTGFAGLFGKPTSKEEVLRKRGAVWANEYEAVPGDEIDQRVQFFARRLPDDVAGCLKIFRKAKGEYQINDELVNMEQRFRQNPQGQTDKEIFAFWTAEAGEQSDPEPLGLYLSHAANVAFEVKQGGNVITQVPEHVRMSFHEERGTKLTDGSADARFTAMEVAARQAKMREEAAMEWREKQTRGGPPEPSPEEQQKIQDRPPSTEGFLGDALSAIGLMQQPAPAPTPVPQQRPAPAAAPMPGYGAPNGHQHHMPMGSNAGTFYGAGQPNGGTFYGAPQQAPFGQMPRQGTMYAYGSAGAAPGAMAAGYAGMPAPMQRQGTHYSTYGAYAVPVR